MTNKNIIWKPQPKQAEFMERPEYEAFYGGAAGGGKSDALVIEALRQVDVPNYKGLILRKTYGQLRELIGKSQFYYKRAFRYARYNGSTHTWTFPSGAQIVFGNIRDTTYKTDYQGLQYDFIAFDELTHFSAEQYAYLRSRNRPSGSGTICYIRATGNPGGIGHGWVKKRFISCAPPETRVWGKIEVEDEHGKTITLRRSRIFIPARVFDNKILLANDPMYLANLGSLPFAERKAMLEGNWDSFSGQVFMEWRDEPMHYMDRRFTHVIEPFRIPRHWEIVRSFDWGHAKPFSVGWWAVDEAGRMIRIRELYGCKKGMPNTGVEWSDDKIAREILRIEKEDQNLKGHNISGVADPAIGLKKCDGYGAASIMAQVGCYFTGANNNRILGKMQLHYRLQFGADGLPMLQSFKTCVNFNEQIKNLVYSEIDVEDVDTKQEDHIYDETRYAVCTHMISEPMQDEKELDMDDPLNQRTDVKFLKA